MIVFDLECAAAGHRFEGWFGSSDDFARQQERGLVSCPNCGSPEIRKAPMAPNVARKGNQRMPAPVSAKAAGQGVAMTAGPPSPETLRMMQAMAAMQAEAIKNSRWVGDSFTEQSRAMHYGEREMENIHGQATIEDAKALLEEGIAVAPLPFPVVPPGEAN